MMSKTKHIIRNSGGVEIYTCEAESFKEAVEKAVSSGAYLREADLRGAYLSGAHLSRADLSVTSGNNREIKTNQLGQFIITYTAETIWIGCESHSIDEWMAFDDDCLSKMDDNALAWRDEWVEIALKIIEKSPATPTGHKANQPAEATP